MQMMRLVRGLGILAVAMAGCKSLDIPNPNQPDARRALADPNALEAVAGGTLRTWMNTMENNPATVLCTQANSCTASWNNDNMNFYSSLDADGTRKQRPWQNDPSAAARTSVENYWIGFYSSLSSANDVLKAIRQDKVVIGTPANTKRSETIAQLMQAADLAEIALNYDKGYVVIDSTDVTTLVYADRKVLRDAALKKFDATVALANANTFTTPTGWSNGTPYDNTQIARIANTMAARLLAYWPRTAAENAQVNWAQVVTYASKGISTGGAFDFIFTGDGCTNWCPEMLTWFDDMTSGRVHTRLAKMLDPVTQKDPWPEPGGNPQPKSLDKRLGNGTFGTAAMVAGYGNVPKDAGAGTDFAFSTQAAFRPSRGQYHQSNIAFTRWDCDGLDDGTSIGSGFCPFPVMMAAQNDLIWAEGLIRGGGDLVLASKLINNTRVTRGGLAPPAAAGDGVTGLLAKLYYEQEIELFALGATPFFNNRRIDNLLAGTPHEMPVPAKELGVFGQALYTWGGTGAANSATPP
jgi:hypothetical protein